MLNVLLNLKTESEPEVPNESDSLLSNESESGLSREQLCPPYSYMLIPYLPVACCLSVSFLVNPLSVGKLTHRFFNFSFVCLV